MKYSNIPVKDRSETVEGRMYVKTDYVTGKTTYELAFYPVELLFDPTIDEDEADWSTYRHTERLFDDD